MRMTNLYMAGAVSNHPHLLCLAVHHSDSICNPGSVKALLPFSDAFRLIECNTWQNFLICVGCHPKKAIKTAYVAVALLKKDIFAQ